MEFTRKDISTDGLIKEVSNSIALMDLPKDNNVKYGIKDCILAGLAIFTLKSPSLLQFDKNAKNIDSPLYKNLVKLFGLTSIPSDTTIRERLDAIPAKALGLAFNKIFSVLQSAKVLEPYQYLDGHYILSVDGTGQFSSDKVNCENCCQKNHKNHTTTYYHHCLAAAIVHPEHKNVLPFAPEPIIKHDGANKNDCERNASKRLLLRIRAENPDLKLIVVEDGLASNYPHLSLLTRLNMNYIIGAKAGDHKHLFEMINSTKPKVFSKESSDVRHEFACYESMPINDKNHEYQVNVLKYTEITKKNKITTWVWVTQLPLTEESVFQIMKAGRARWRIENETFNTIKNQGYNFQHNYGHGYKNLCSLRPA